MPDFSALRKRLRHEGFNRQLRNDIVDAISATLDQVSERLSTWEKGYLLGAIDAIDWNTRKTAPKATIGLYLALGDAERALCPPQERNDDYGPADEVVDSMSASDIRDAIADLRSRLASEGTEHSGQS